MVFQKMPKYSVDLIIILILVLISFTRPYLLVNFINTTLGRFIIIIIISFMAMKNTYLGLFAVLVFSLLRNNEIFEGFENTENKRVEFNNINRDQYEIDTWRQQYCEKNKVMLNGKEIQSKDIKNKFPNISFLEEDCNPCDLGCRFELSSANAQLDNDEKLRSKSSNSLPNLKNENNQDEEKVIRMNEMNEIDTDGVSNTNSANETKKLNISSL